MKVFRFLFSKWKEEKDRRMKIVQVISDSNIGGAGVLMKRICEALAGEFEFTVVVPKGAELKRLFEKETRKETLDARDEKNEHRNTKRDCGQSQETIRVVEMKMAKDRSFRLSDVERFRRFFLREKPDVVHTHATFSARIGAKMAGVKTVLSTRHCAKKSRENYSFLYSKVYNMVTDMTIATAEYAKKNLTEEGVNADKICVIFNGSPRTLRTSDIERASLKKSLGIPDGALVLGSVARLENVKGQDLMIEGLSMLVHEHRCNAHLVLVGTGKAERSYRALAREKGLSERIHFVGYTDEPYLYQNIFDINLNASRGTETSCLATSECMSLGVVTVASDFGGNREMIRHGASGLLFPCGDVFGMVNCIRRLVDEPRFARALSDGARILYENVYSLEQMAEKYRQLYRSCKE